MGSKGVLLCGNEVVGTGGFGFEGDAYRVTVGGANRGGRGGGLTEYCVLYIYMIKIMMTLMLISLTLYSDVTGLCDPQAY